jgi:hypothetical protein
MHIEDGHVRQACSRTSPMIWYHETFPLVEECANRMERVKRDRRLRVFNYFRDAILMHVFIYSHIRNTLGNARLLLH